MIKKLVLIWSFNIDTEIENTFMHIHASSYTENMRAQG